MMSILNTENRMRTAVLSAITGVCMIAASFLYQSGAVTYEIVNTEASHGGRLDPHLSHTGYIPELNDIFFDFKSSEIRDDALPVLAENADILKNNPGTYVVIEGYCGKAESSTKGLAQTRADTVKDYIVSEGVDADRIITIGMCTLCGIGLDSSGPYHKLERRVHFTSVDKYIDNDFFFG